MFKDRGFLFTGLILMLLLLSLSACKDKSPGNQGVVLMKLGDRVVTVNEYKQAFEMAMAAYPIKALTDRSHIKVAKVRLLNQMTDELVIINRADELKFTITDEELNTAVNHIIKDYPDQTFDQILVEQSISFNRWRESLRKRLLIEKTIRKDIRGFSEPEVDSVDSTEPESLEKIDEPDDSSNLREVTLEEEEDSDTTRAQDVYAAWMVELRKTHPVFIDETRWKNILEE